MKKNKITALLISSMLAVSTLLTACGSTNAPATDGGAQSAPANDGAEAPAASGDTSVLSVVTGPEPDTIDPALNSAADVGTFLVHTFEGLMTLDENGQPIYGQAESSTVSEDGLTYTFKLRDGLAWSDGSPITANDFVYSWNRVITPETAADYAYMFECIEGYADGKLAVTAVDDKTLEVKLIAVTPYFLELCAFPAYMPVQQATVEANGDGWATDPSTYISNGAYVMKEWVHNSYILVEKNPNFWNADKIVSNQIKFLLMEEDAAQLAAYETGEAVFIDTVPNDEIPSLEKQPDYHVAGQLGTYYVSYNVNSEALKDPMVRKALTLALDREYIVKEIGKAGQMPAGAFVSIGLSDADVTKEFREVGGDYYDPTDYEGNLEIAKKTLADAGYPNGEGLPVIEYLYNEGTGHQQIGEALQDMWGKLGVRVELVSQEWATFLNTRKSHEYDVARNGWLGDYNDPISFLDMWITDGGNNDAGWSNPEYDKLITQIKSSSDPAERMKLMHDAEKLIFDDWMLCPIYYYTDIYMLKENVEGFYASKLGYKYFMYASVK